MLRFGLRSTSDDQLGWSMDSNPICHPSPAKKWIAQFGITLNFWWSAGLIDGLKPHPPSLFSQKMKCSFLDYVQLLMIGWAGGWTQTPSATSLQPKKWNACFWITFNFYCWLGWLMDSNPICHPPAAKKIKCSFLDCIQLLMLARLVNGLEPHLPPLSSLKNEILDFGLHSLLMIGWAGQWTWNPSATHLQSRKWNAHFRIMFNFWWLAGLVNGLKPHLSPISSQKMKYSYLDYVLLLMIGWAGQWTQTPSKTPLQPNNWNTHFWITFTSDDQPGWLMDSKPICHPSPSKKMKCSYLDYIRLPMIGQTG